MQWMVSNAVKIINLKVLLNGNKTLLDVPEPIYSTLRGVADSLTNFVSVNVWDQLFRYTLLSTNCQPATMKRALQLHRPVGQEEVHLLFIWIQVFYAALQIK